MNRTATANNRFTGADGPRVIGPHDGEKVDLSAVFGVRFMAWTEETGGGFSLVEHPIAPRGLAAPLHRHSNEDEYSFVLEGRMGAQLGDDVVEAGVGDLVFKPRDQWHSFWNAGDEPCRILEIISPSGFERYFAELPEAIAAAAPNGDEAVGAAIAEVAARYGLEIDPSSIGPLCERHGLVPPR
jgi:mannose-6-phosphate isomerase-like protein (cupin superfamily)